MTTDWNLETLYASEAEVESDFLKIKDYMETFVKFKGTLNTKENLLKYYKTLEEYSILMEKFGVYLFLRKSLNGKDNFSRNIEAKLDFLSQEYSPKMVYISNEILKNPADKLIEWAKDPEFSHYDIMIKDLIREKKHILPEKIKAVLSLNNASGKFDEIFDNFNDVDLKFGKIKTPEGVVELTHATYSNLVKHKNQNVRKSAYNKMHKAFADFNYTLGSLYLSDVNESLFYSKIHKFKTLLEESCFEDKTSSKILPVLIEVVHNHLPLFYEYEKIKKKYLKLDKFYYFDNNVELGEFNKQYSYQEATEIVLDALSVMGDDYINNIKQALNNGWIDVYEKPAKTSGGFNVDVYGHHPYILLNYVGNFNDVSTLAHELGHAMHGYMSSNSQPITKSQASIFACEVASIVNEVILVNYMINKAKTKDEKIFYINSLLNNFVATLFRQTMFSEFEYYVYSSIENKKPVLVEDLNNKYEKLQQLYFGKEVLKTPYAKYEWSRIPHFYRPYYVYKYATGFISACTIANRIMSGDKEYLKKYFGFLSAGSSKSPMDLLKEVDVDLTKKETLSGAFEVFEKLIKQLDELTKE